MGDGPYRVWKNRMKGTNLVCGQKHIIIRKQVKRRGFIRSSKVIIPIYIGAYSTAMTILLQCTTDN